tara:strand:- start:3295 stop:5514 length:2220 start_codon:yes stop_codon:yes gene_type:complete
MSSNIRRQKKEAFIKRATSIQETTKERENILDERYELLMLCEELAELNSAEHLDEGFWEKFKHKTAKALGKYKVGGKIFGKDKIEARAAKELKSLLDKVGNEKIKELDKGLQTQFPEFPNNEEKEKFTAGLATIGAVYDSIKGANSKCETPYEVNQELVKDLRRYVQKLLDVDLLSTYRFVTEDEEVIEEEDIDEVSLKGIGQSIKKGAKDFFSVDDGGEVMSGTKDSATMKGLKSNKLPLLLAGIGSALGGLSWLTSTDWFKSLFDQPTLTDTLKYAKETVGNVFGSIKPGEGMTQILSRTLEGVDLDPSSSPEEFLAAIKRVGGGDITKGIAEMTQEGGIFANADGAKGVLEAIAADPHGHGDTLGQMFQGTWAGTMKQAGDLLGTVQGGTLAGMIIKPIATVITKQGVKTAATYGVAKGLGAMLGPIGITVIGAGALVKMARMYGAKYSRAAALNKTLQAMDDLQDECNCPEGEVWDPKEKACVEVADIVPIPPDPNKEDIDPDKEDIDPDKEDKGDDEGIWKRLIDWVNGEDEQVPPEIIVKIPAEAFKKSRNLQFAYMLGLGGVPVPAFQYNPETKEVNTKFTGDNSGAGPNARQIINIRKAGPQYFLNRLAAMYPGITHNKEIRVKALTPGEKGKRNIPDNLKVYKVPTAGKKVKVMSAEKLQELRDNPVEKWKYIFRGIKGITSTEAMALNKMWKNTRLPKFLKSNFTNYGFKYSAPPPAVGAEEELATAAQ